MTAFIRPITMTCEHERGCTRRATMEVVTEAGRAIGKFCATHALPKLRSLWNEEPAKQQLQKPATAQFTKEAPGR